MPPLEPAASTPPMPAMQQPLPEMVAAKSPTPNVTTLREEATNKHVARTSGESYAVSASRRAAPANPAAAAASTMIAPQVASDSNANAARPPLQEAAPGALRMRGRMPVAPTPIGPFTGTDTASNASDTPAQELDKIRHLFALGRDDEARQRLTAFHLAHPRWDLPLDLQPRLSKP